jgi:hypothetical protein
MRWNFAKRRCSLTRKSFSITSSCDQACHHPGTVEEVGGATSFEDASSRLVGKLWKPKVCCRGDLVAEVVVHGDFEDFGALQVASVEESPPIEELLNAHTPNAKWFRQVAVAETSLARHTARDDHRTSRLGKKTAP